MFRLVLNHFRLILISISLSIQAFFEILLVVFRSFNHKISKQKHFFRFGETQRKKLVKTSCLFFWIGWLANSDWRWCVQSGGAQTLSWLFQCRLCSGECEERAWFALVLPVHCALICVQKIVFVEVTHMGNYSMPGKWDCQVKPGYFSRFEPSKSNLTKVWG